MKRIIFLLCFGLFTAFSFAQAPVIDGAERVQVIDGDTLADFTIDDIVSFAALGAGSGTVTSVGLTLPSEFSVSGSPVTTTGTLAGSWATQTTNKVFAAPNGSTGVPTFRALVAADIPNLDVSKLTTGTLAVNRGGTGVATFASNRLVIGNGTSPLSTLTLGGANTFVGMNSGGTAHEYKTFSAGTTGTDFAIAHGSGTIAFNLPDAGTSARGVVTSTAQTLGGTKTFDDGFIAVNTDTDTPAAEFQGVQKHDVVTLSTNTTLSAAYDVVYVNATSGNITLTIPAASGRTGWRWKIVKTDASTNHVILSGDFEASVTSKIIASQWVRVTVENNGTDYGVSLN